MWLTPVKNVIKWLWAHWYVPVGVISSAVVYSLGRRGATPAERLQVELDAAQAKLQVSSIAVEQGADAAHAHIEQNYASQIANLSEQERKDAKTLSDSPPALAAFLVRAGAGIRSASQVNDGGNPPVAGPPATGSKG